MFSRRPDRYVPVVNIDVSWRGRFANQEVNELHAAAFRTRLYGDDEWNWNQLVENHSVGWVVARIDGRLVGFANVVWDGLVHAWIQDVMVAERVGRQGIGTALVGAAADGARIAGCETLHVDFDAHLSRFYIDACGFTPTSAGLLDLSMPSEQH
jgi:GNAT superfamily N-acetyltransferase